MKLSVTKVFRFEASHFLTSCDTEPCKNLHGHSYVAEVTLRRIMEEGVIEGGVHPGMLADFGGPVFKGIKVLIETMDHALLLPEGVEASHFLGNLPMGKVMYFKPQPTAEVMAIKLAQAICGFYRRGDLPVVKGWVPDEVEVSLWETASGKATCCMGVN
jgi:6-pyruvoyl-tetrahydropterin synthase